MMLIRLLGLLSLMAPVWALGQSDEDTTTAEWDAVWEEDWESDSAWDWSGHISWGYGRRLSNDDRFETQSTLSEWRARVELNHSSEKRQWRLLVDGVADAVLDREQVKVREAFVMNHFNQSVSLKLGRQVSTWGTGDLLFLNDLFPKDWEAFFSGRDGSLIKAPSDSVRLNVFHKNQEWDLIWTPEFTPDRYIKGVRLGFEGMDPNTQYPNEPSGSEWALRWRRSFGATEVATYAYHGFTKQPEFSGEVVLFSGKNVVGMSIRGDIGEGVYHAEMAKYVRLGPDSTSGSGDQWRWLIGYERELASRLTWSAQYYLEHNNSASVGHRDLITQRLTHRSAQAKWTSGVFLFYSPKDEDWYWRPSVQYRPNDEWLITLGANVFDGRDSFTQFARFEDSSNAYLRVRMQF